MKRLVLMFLVMPFFLTGCFGYSSINAEAIGQIKSVEHATPLIVNNYYAVDLSLGVMRHGVGSMSTSDVFFDTYDQNIANKLKKIALNGNLVKVKYNVVRVPIVGSGNWIRSISVVK